ncbi:hypothetical protein ACLOJK_007392 [Asimina triloba]
MMRLRGDVTRSRWAAGWKGDRMVANDGAMLAVTCRWVLTPILNVFETYCPIIDYYLEMKLSFAEKMGCYRIRPCPVAGVCLIGRCPLVGRDVELTPIVGLLDLDLLGGIAGPSPLSIVAGC